MRTLEQRMHQAGARFSASPAADANGYEMWTITMTVNNRSLVRSAPTLEGALWAIGSAAGLADGLAPPKTLKLKMPKTTPKKRW